VTADDRLTLRPVGRVVSELADLGAAPKQGHEGAPEATVEFDRSVAGALEGLAPGDDVLLLTWLDRADRSLLQVHPRGDTANPVTGVFNTRSPARPNPIGLHPVSIVALDGLRMRVRPLEAVDGTPVLDVKSALDPRPRAGDPEVIAADVVEAESYMTLATADADGRPWASPVWFAHRDLREFVWVSRPEATHSRNVAVRPQVGIVLFDTRTPPGGSHAVYVEALAAEVPDTELDDALAVYAERSERHGLPPWSRAEVTGSAPFRLYRAVAVAHSMLDSGSTRRSVSL
jgi:tRNA-Thr(GGU) m(6)t(6)A37 methyltransferase TsaA